MNPLTRRNFLTSSAACAVLGANYLPAGALAGPDRGEPPGEVVRFQSDGLELSSTEYTQLLTKLAKDGRAGEDNYLEGGCVTELETRFAKLLGKERAVFLPTGTLANHLAIHCQAGGKSR